MLSARREAAGGAAREEDTGKIDCSRFTGKGDPGGAVKTSAGEASERDVEPSGNA